MNATSIRRRELLALTSGLGAALALPGLARAQAWPSKPLQMVVPQGAGGSTDAIARLVGQALGDVVVHGDRLAARGHAAPAPVAAATAEGRVRHARLLHQSDDFPCLSDLLPGSLTYLLIFVAMIVFLIFKPNGLYGKPWG